MGVNVYEQLTFDGVSTAEFGVWISGGGTFDAPARDIETISVPGRNGDLYFDNGRYRNITVSYPAFISNRFQPRIDDFRAWLCSHVGYYRLEDTYHPDEYRMAMFKGSVSVSTAPRNIAGRFTLSFDCKPQRWLKSGENAITYTANGHIYNPTRYNAKPLYHFYGTPGNNVAFNINSSQQIGFIMPTGGELYLDVETGEAYLPDGTNANNLIAYAETNVNHQPPEIMPGDNTVLMWALSRVDITPRWWTL